MPSGADCIQVLLSYPPVCRMGIPSTRRASMKAVSSSVIPGKAITNARARSPAYATRRWASPGGTPPNIIATRARISAKWTAPSDSFPRGIRRRSRPTFTPDLTSDSTTPPERNVRRSFSCNSRHTAAALSGDAGLPTIRVSPRMLPSTRE